MNIFHPLEVVSRVWETQLQVGEKLKDIKILFMLLSWRTPVLDKDEMYENILFEKKS